MPKTEVVCELSCIHSIPNGCCNKQEIEMVEIKDETGNIFIVCSAYEPISKADIGWR